MQTPPLVRFLDRTTPPHIATLVFLSGLSALAMNVFLPSLPQMTEYFQTDYTLIQLSVAGYLAVNAVLQILIGPLSDQMGRRPVILGALVIFCIATVGCLLANSIWVFLFFRMVQAAIVTGMVLSRAVVRDIVPQDQAASMIAYVTMGMALVPMISPTIGGILASAFGWQASFVLMLVLGIVMLWLAWRDLGETSGRSGKTLLEQFRDYPVLIRSPRFWGYALSCAFASGAFFSFLGGSPYIGSEVYGLNESVIGYYLGAPAIGYFLGNFFSGRYSARYGVNLMVFWGALTVGSAMLALLILYYVVEGSAFLFFGFMCFVGLGNGMAIPNATAGMLSVRPHLAGTASGLGGAIMIGGGAALSAYAGVLVGPGAGVTPLLWLMAATSIASVFAISFVIWRARQIGA